MSLDSPRYILLKDGVVLAGSYAQDYVNRFRRKLNLSAAYRVFLRAYAEDRISQADLKLFVAVVLRAVRIAREKYNVKTIIPYNRYDDEVLRRTAGQTDDDVIRAFPADGLQVLDVTLPQRMRNEPSARFTLLGDGHPSPLAHLTCAAMLYDFVGAELRRQNQQVLEVLPRESANAAPTVDC